MDRRDFLRKACGAGAGGALILTGAAPLGGQSSEDAAARSAAEAAREACEKERAFSRNWIVNVVGNMEGKLDETAAAAVLEECGRNCARLEAIKLAIENRGDLERFLAAYRGWIGERNVLREGDTVTVVYDKCYCPNVRDSENVPATYCNCSRGWTKEMFETVTGKPCEVSILSSIKRGGTECRLAVRV